MKFKLKIQQKIQMFIISASIIIYIVALGYISLQARKMAYNDAINITDQYVQNYAKDIADQLNSDMTVVKTLSNAFLIYETLPKSEWKNLFKEMYLKVYSQYPHFNSLWDSWELSAIDSTWTKSHGRYVMMVARDISGKIITDSSYRSIEKESQIYDKIIKKRRVPSIWEPYLDNYAVGENERSLMTTLNSPIMNNNKYIGIVGIDIRLDNFQQIVSEINPFEGSYAYMISYGGLIAGHPNREYLQVNLEDVLPYDFETYNILRNIQSGKPFSYTSINEEGLELYYSYAPIIVKGTNTPWSIAISVPVKTIMAAANKSFAFRSLLEY